MSTLTTLKRSNSFRSYDFESAAVFSMRLLQRSHKRSYTLYARSPLHFFSRFIKRLYLKRRIEEIRNIQPRLQQQGGTIAECDMLGKPKGLCCDSVTLGDQCGAVADGVSGFKLKGMCPRDFSQQLTKSCIDLCSEELSDTSLLQSAYDRVSAYGGATLLMYKLENTKLQISWVGDCQLMLFRKGTLIYSTAVHMQTKNCPYQLVKTSHYNENTQTESQNIWEQVQTAQITVKYGDILVAGSDGLFDNLHTAQIQNCIQEKHVTSILKKLVMAAKKASVSPMSKTPFAQRNPGYRGGKPDDIAVIVAKVIL